MAWTEIFDGDNLPVAPTETNKYNLNITAGTSSTALPDDITAPTSGTGTSIIISNSAESTVSLYVRAGSLGTSPADYFAQGATLTVHSYHSAEAYSSVINGEATTQIISAEGFDELTIPVESLTGVPADNDQVIHFTVTDTENVRSWTEDSATGEANVQSDWDETDTESDTFIQNKPTVPAAQVSSDWDATEGVSVIANKPTIPDAQVSSDWDATEGVSVIANKPTIPAAQVASDWDATEGVSAIANKPTIPAAQVASDWDATEGVSAIANKPTVPSVPDAPSSEGDYHISVDAMGTASWGATSAEENAQANWNETDNTSDSFIQNKPTIPAAQVQTDWGQTDTESLDFIKNKPTLTDVPSAPTSNGHYNLQVNGTTLTWNDDNISSVVEGLTATERRTVISDLLSSLNDDDNTADRDTARGDLDAQQAVASLNGVDRWALLQALFQSVNTDDERESIRNSIEAQHNLNTPTVEGKYLGDVDADGDFFWSAYDGEVNVQSDWDVTDSTNDSFIKNKPSIPSFPTEAGIYYVSVDSDGNVSWADFAELRSFVGADPANNLGEGAINLGTGSSTKDVAYRAMAIGRGARAARAKEVRIGNSASIITKHPKRIGNEEFDEEIISKKYVDDRLVVKSGPIFPRDHPIIGQEFYIDGTTDGWTNATVFPVGANPFESLNVVVTDHSSGSASFKTAPRNDLNSATIAYEQGTLAVGDEISLSETGSRSYTVMSIASDNTITLDEDLTTIDQTGATVFVRNKASILIPSSGVGIYKKGTSSWQQIAT